MLSYRQEPLRDRFWNDLYEREFKSLRTDIEALARPDGLLPDVLNLWRWLDDFFAYGGSRYVGVDSHVPTEYLDQYKLFLDIHARAMELNSHREGTINTRIIVSTLNDLTNDYFKDSSAFLDFIKWHDTHNVKLKWIQVSKLRRIATEHNVASDRGSIHPDVALWEHYAVLFERSTTGSVVSTLRMRFPKDHARQKLEPAYEELAAYVDAVDAAAEPFPNGPPGLEVVSQKMATRWREYVDVDYRLRKAGALATFLRKELDGAELVLDAAAGIGCEAILLQGLGFGVISNEVDENLRVEAEKLANEHQQRLALEQHMWERLPDKLEGGLKFDAILCLGNSLCLVPDVKRQAESLAGFNQLLRPGGLLVIDERNFSWMLIHRDNIMRDPVAEWPHLEGDVMYAGQSVRGFPASIAEDRIEWVIYDNTERRSTRAEMLSAAIDNPLELRPFRAGELHALLEKNGFEVLRIYADLEEVSNGAMPSQSKVGEAAFLTYVAKLSGSTVRRTRPQQPLSRVTGAPRR